MNELPHHSVMGLFMTAVFPVLIIVPLWRICARAGFSRTRTKSALSLQFNGHSKNDGLLKSLVNVNAILTDCSACLRT